MATLTMSLPEPLKEWVETQARSSRYGDAAAYVRDLIRQDQDRVAGIAALQAQVTEGLESGISARSADDIRRLSREMCAAHGA